MRILFDHGTPRPLAWALSDHSVSTAVEQGWEGLSNGELLRDPEGAGFELLLTTDRRIRYQPSLSNRPRSIVVLIGSTKCSRVSLHRDQIVFAVGAAGAGGYVEVPILFR